MDFAVVRDLIFGRYPSLKSMLHLNCGHASVGKVFLDNVPELNYLGVISHDDHFGSTAEKEVPQWSPTAKVKRWDFNNKGLPSGIVQLALIHPYHNYHLAYKMLHLASQRASYLWITDYRQSAVREATHDFIERHPYYNISFFQGDVHLSIKREAWKWQSEGDLGDTIYQLHTISKFGAAEICLAPGQVRQPYTKDNIDNIASLLMKQPYILKVNVGHDKDAIDMSVWRDCYNYKISLADMMADTFNTNRVTEPWLKCEEGMSIAPVIISRSARYHEWSDCSWQRILWGFKNWCAFLGTTEEHQDLIKRTGVTIPHLPCRSLWECTQYVKGASLVIANQSAILSIALGLGRNTLVEESKRVPNCRVPFKNAYYCNDSNLIMFNKHVRLPKIELSTGQLDFSNSEWYNKTWEN